MSEKIGRNDLCPCGSGKKYKKCCLLGEQEIEMRRREEGTAVPRALDWLAQRYPDEVVAVMDAHFRAVLEDDELERLANLPPELEQMVFINSNEWLINDARIQAEGRETAVREILLGPGGPLLSAAARNWLERLGERPLGLYEVRRVLPGEGVELADLLHPADPPVWVAERSASRTLVRHDIFGTRLVRCDSGFVMSGAAYPFTRDEGIACRDDLLLEMKKPGWVDDYFRDTVAAVMITRWFCSLVAERPVPKLVDSSSGEAVMLTTDRYRVQDWQALESILAAQPDVEGTRSEGWVRFVSLGGEMRRSLAALNPKGGDVLEVFCRTVRLADEARQWLERVAPGVAVYRIREMTDPRSEMARASFAGTAKEEIPPEVANRLINEYMGNFYANWTEEPIPALGNKTPRAAIETEQGRGAVVDLLKSYEHQEARRVRDQGGEPFDFRFLWQRLGLERDLS